MSMLDIIKDVFIPKSTFLTCQIRGHNIDQSDKFKINSVIKCTRYLVPLYIKDDRIREFYSPEDYHKYKDSLA